MQQYRNFAPLDVLPSTWLDAIERFISVAAPQFTLRIKPTDATVLEVPASADTGAAAIAIEGKLRWNEATVERVMPTGGSARDMDVWVTSTANAFAAGSPGEVDNTVYAFALSIQETGVLPTGVAIKRKVGTARWDGTNFATVTPTVGTPPQLPPLSPERNLKIVRGLGQSVSEVVGSGWSEVVDAIGEVTITFTVPFSARPTVTASGDTVATDDLVVTVSGVTASSAHFSVRVRGSGAPSVKSFSFIAIGPA